VAHDFNNLLTVIVGYTELMLPDTREGDPMRAPLLDVHAAALRAAALTRQLLAFSRKQILQPRVLDLNALITESTNMLRRLLGEHLNLVLSLDRNLARVKADPGQLDQVIVNLAVNARDAMSQAGTLTIETHNVLSTAHGIIEQSGGWITVSSEPGAAAGSTSTCAASTCPRQKPSSAWSKSAAIEARQPCWSSRMLDA